MRNPKLAAAASQDAQPKKKASKKKDQFVLPEFDWNKTPGDYLADIEDLFTLGRAATTLTDKVMTSWKDFHQLPDDHQVNSKTYYRSVFFKIVFETSVIGQELVYLTTFRKVTEIKTKMPPKPLDKISFGEI